MIGRCFGRLFGVEKSVEHCELGIELSRMSDRRNKVPANGGNEREPEEGQADGEKQDS